MILGLLLVAGLAQGPVEAERAFAAMAQTDGQWTAFRANAAAEAVMFTPAEVNAQQWLKDRADPPVSVMWWPAAAFLSCDGRAAVTTGPWLRGGGKLSGYFTTIWVKQPDGSWRWVLDHGDSTPRPRAAGDEVKPRRAACTAPSRAPGSKGGSADGTLRWTWQVEADGARRVTAWLWDGRRYVEVVDDPVSAR